MKTHSVARGETSAMIARRYGVSQTELFAANPQLRLAANKYGEWDFAPSQFVRGVRLNIPSAQDGQVGCGGGISASTWRRVLSDEPSGAVARVQHPGPPVYEARGFGWPPSAGTLKTQLSPVQLQAMLQQIDHARAQAFASAYRPGDQIWVYDTMTVPLSGARGVYLLRDGKVVADLVLVVS
jgi:hypothetical protein